jgi:RNA polymerase sigma-70 factor (ECF subfamily)
VFESRYGEDLDYAIDQSRNVGVMAREEFRQQVRERLFVARAGTVPRIAEYSGRGPLRRWLRVVTVRMIVDLARKHRVRPERLPARPDFVDETPEKRHGPEHAYAQARFTIPVQEAFETAFAALTARQRNLLRHHVLHGLGIDQIACIYGIHRATAARWIDRARQGLTDATRDRLIQTLAIDAREVQSIFALVQSQVEVSIRRVLGSGLEGDRTG